VKMHKSITQDRVIAAVHEDDCIGFCIDCGAETSGVEPDAKGYPCDECGSNAVYGAEQLLFEFL